MDDRPDEKTLGIDDPEPPTPTNSERGGFGDLAGKIARRTTDLIAIGIGVGLCLLIGFALTDWYGDAEDAPTDSPVDIEGVTGRNPLPTDAGVRLRFGSSPQIFHREELVGPREGVVERFRDLAAKLTAEASVTDRSAGPDETKFLARLRTDSNVESVSLPNGRRVIVVPGPATMVAGIGGDGEAERLLLWGTMFPAGRDRYRIHIGIPGGTEDPDHGWPSFPFPTGAVPGLRVNSDAGGMTGFSGFGTLDRWQTEITRGFLARNWEPLRGWTTIPQGTSSSTRCRFAPKSTTNAAPNRWIDVSLVRDGGENLSESQPNSGPVRGLALFARVQKK